MDDFEQQLKRDADAIEATVSRQLRARIDASLHAARDVEVREAPPRTAPSRWWLSSLTGLAAAILIIAFLNVAREDASPETEETTAALPSRADSERLFPQTFPLETRPAVLTSPLEKELEALRSDLEKARNSVEQDIKLAF
ncbi:MAG: hypothetical protein ACR2QR_04205 [Woeseiaceae bacterium]